MCVCLLTGFSSQELLHHHSSLLQLFLSLFHLLLFSLDHLNPQSRTSVQARVQSGLDWLRRPSRLWFLHLGPVEPLQLLLFGLPSCGSLNFLGELHIFLHLLTIMEHVLLHTQTGRLFGLDQDSHHLC